MPRQSQLALIASRRQCWSNLLWMSRGSTWLYPTRKKFDPRLVSFFCYTKLDHFLPEQITPISKKWGQVKAPHPVCEQFQRADSLPRQSTRYNHVGPVPCPKGARFRALTADPHCSCLQTTSASLMVQSPSHTVPHCSSCFTSTLPEQGPVPFDSLNSSVPSDRARL